MSRFSKLLQGQLVPDDQWEMALPSETNSTRVAHVVPKNLAGQNVVAQEDGAELL